MWFIFPISVAVLLFGFLVLPSRPQQDRAADKSDYLKAFKGILLNKSALACVLANLLISISCLTPVYAVSFYTLTFNDSLTTSATYYSLASAMGIFGVLVGGRLINRIGRKSLVVTTFTVQGIFATLIVFMPNSLASATMWMTSAFFASAGLTCLTSLALEQVPDFRGTMMSMNTSFQNIGLIVGLVISGLILNLYSNNFFSLYVMFGVCGVASAAVLYFFAEDPCRNQLPSTP